MFHYEVLTEEQAMAERFQLMKEGVYEAVVHTSMDTLSKGSNNNMMDMTLRVFDEQGKEHDIRDFLVFTKGMMWKIIHFAESAGLMNEYNAGKLCSAIVVDKVVKVKVSIEKGKEIPADKLKGKAPGTCYSDKNKIEDYVSNEDNDNKIKEDEIPF